MKQPLEFAPLLIAAVAGALILTLVVSQFDTSNTNRTNTTFYMLTGLGVGAAVQLTVRVLGVS